MQIELTNQEYRDLIDIFFLAHWLLTAHRVGSREDIAHYSQLEQKLLALAPGLGFGDLVEYAPEQDAYFTTRQYEDQPIPQAYIDQYDNDTFWHQLIERLAQRDLVRQVGGYEQVAELTFDERMGRMLKLEQTYAAEFQANGLDNLHLLPARGRQPRRNGT